MSNLKRTSNPSIITVESVPNFAIGYGRYACDWNCSEAHLFNNVADAKKYAQSRPDKNWNIGWLAPIYCHATGTNHKATPWEAKLQIARYADVTDHRRDK